MQNKLCGILEITQDLEKSVLGLFPGPADSWICHLEQNIHLSWDLNFLSQNEGFRTDDLWGFFWLSRGKNDFLLKGIVSTVMVNTQNSNYSEGKVSPGAIQ